MKSGGMKDPLNIFESPQVGILADCVGFLSANGTIEMCLELKRNVVQ